MSEQVKRYALINDTGTWTATMQEMGGGAYMMFHVYARDIKALEDEIERLRHIRHRDAMRKRRLTRLRKHLAEQAETITRLRQTLETLDEDYGWADSELRTRICTVLEGEKCGPTKTDDPVE